MPVATAASARPRRARPRRARPRRFLAVAGLAALAVIAAALGACGSRAGPSPSPSAAPLDPRAAQGGDLFAVVTGDDVDTLVGIDVASHAVTRLAVLGPNLPQPHMDGGMASVPPQSVVLTDSTRPNLVLWTWAAGAGTVVQELDSATGELHDVNAPRAGHLPFLTEGRLGWASLPRDGKPRLLSAEGAFEIGLPGEPWFVVPGPGPGRITVVVDQGDPNGDHRDERIVIVDIGKQSVHELPTERVHFGGIWADQTTLVASVFATIEPTPDDPENGEPDRRVLTWSLAGPDPSNAVLVEGPTLRTAAFYPAHVAGGDGLVVAETGVFDAPNVEALALGAGDLRLNVDLAPSEFIYAMSVVGTTLVVLQSAHVTFIDLQSGKRTIVDLGGGTQTQWVGP